MLLRLADACFGNLKTVEKIKSVSPNNVRATTQIITIFSTHSA